MEVIEAFSGMLKRALPQENRDLDPKSKRQKPASTSAQSEAKTDHASVVDDLDVLIVQEDGELDEAEDKLCNPSAQLETGNNTDNDSLLKDIEHEYEDDDCVGEKVRDDLAKIVNGRFRGKLRDELLKERFEAHKRPENCTELVVPTVNSEIWTKLSIPSRKADLKMALTQRAFVTSAIAATKVANELLGLAGARGDLVKGCTDALAILGHASRDLVLRRRAAIRPFLNKLIQRICDESTPIIDKLFSDNLSTTLKAAKEMARIGAEVSATDKRGGSWLLDSQSGRSLFLGQGRGFSPRQRGSPHNFRGRRPQRHHFRGRGYQSLSYFQ